MQARQQVGENKEVDREIPERFAEMPEALCRNKGITS